MISRAADYHIIRPSQSPGKQRGRTIYSTMKMTQARPKAMQANMQIRPACTCMCLSRARRTHISRFWHPTASSHHLSHSSRPSNHVVRTIYSDHPPHRNDDRHHNDRPESSRVGQLRQHRPDNAIRRRPDTPSKAKSRFNILLNILQSPYIAIMFLRTVFSIFALQTIFRTPE